MRTLTLAFALTLPVTSFAYDTAAEVLANCGADPKVGLQEAMKSLHCSGYLTGIVDGVLMMQSAGPNQKKYICLSGVASGKQTLKAVTRWLQENPTRADASARVAVLNALVATYPCPTK